LASRARAGGAGRWAAALLWLVLFVPARGTAAEKAAPPPSPLPARVETQHTITLAGRPLNYRAVAETIGLTNPKGEPVASVFTVSYLADLPAGQRRPVAFVFNGGPGAASVFLHLGALGPRILESPPSGAVPTPPYRLVDNPATWLAFTDLVFVDPVGTGFSRAEGKGKDPDKPFWNVRGDVESLGAVVRRWLTRHKRWDAPIYLVGESYGGLRVAGLAHHLEHEVGITVSGLVMISPALDVALLHPDISNALAPAFELPSYAAAAAALSGKGSPIAAAQAAAKFALSGYLVGLAQLAGLPPPEDPFIARVAATIGLPAEIVRRQRGRVPSRLFARELRRPEHQILSLYDATVGRPAGANPQRDEAGDPVLGPAVAAYTTAFEHYVQEALGYKTEEPYKVLPHRVSEEWDWEGARHGRDGLGLALSALEDTLLVHPETRVLIANGRYDLVTPYLASRWLVDQLALSPALRARIRLRVYSGGHMMYMRAPARAALAADAAALFAAP
jgi:carboxypeptidase C (cathepsin A)